jgi:2-methylisocitrate lyase-like PEP mutase family enzyme
MKSAAILRNLLGGHAVAQAGGVGDAGQARLVEDVGYPAVYVSGAYVNHTRGYPDGTLTLSEIATRVREVAERVSVPVVADADEGFGGTLKIVRTVREFENAGAAALHIEDFTTKKHGVPIPIPDMVRHLNIVLDTRRDKDFVVIARTDAMAPWRTGVRTELPACEEEAFERALAYCEAGADAIMPLYASNEWLQTYGPRIPKPLVVLAGAPKAWFGAETAVAPPELELAELAKANVRMQIFSTNMLARSFRFMKEQYAQWLKDGRFDATAQDERDRADANLLIGLKEKEALLNRFGE